MQRKRVGNVQVLEKENHAKFKYYTGIIVEVFHCLLDYFQAEKDIEAVKKLKKRDTDYYQGPIDNDIDEIKTEHSI